MLVTDMLKDRHMMYDVMMHPKTYSARHMAHALHLSEHDVAKTVALVDPDGWCTVAVLPADRSVDLPRTRELLGCDALTLLEEDQLSELFPDCEPGAVPPFGSEYGMTTIVDVTLADHDDIVFEGNSHTEAVRMRFEDFKQIEHPRIEDIVFHD